MKRTFILLCLVAVEVCVAQSSSVKDLVEQLKKQGKKEGWTFQVGENEILGLPYAMDKKFWIDSDKKRRESSCETRGRSFRYLPSYFDWRTKGIVRPVRNQNLPGSCGSCWAMATVAAFESVIHLATGNAVTLSPQQLISCDAKNSGCYGGIPDKAVSFYENNGANYEDDFPYEADDISCDKSAARHEKVQSWGCLQDTDGREPSIAQIKEVLMERGPLITAISANDAFAAYESGVFNACSKAKYENHSVVIVGWDDVDEAWIIKNSWGKKYGENGYIRMSYHSDSGKKCSHVGEYVVWIKPKL